MNGQLSYLIIGNGITGVTAAEMLRAMDPVCSITVVAEELFPVYYRPALKDYLAGRMSEDRLWAQPATFYQEQRVRFVPGRVVGIDVAGHFVQLHSGQRVGYDKLLLAQGARSRPLSCPGAHRAGVTTLRTVMDYQQMLRRLADVERIVVCGSGTLGVETAETLRKQGYEVTHLLRHAALWSEILDRTASDLVIQEERRAGIDVRVEEEIAEIVGDGGRVTGVITSGGRRIRCEMVVVAIGIEPIIDFVQAADIACGRGVQVDAAMRTNAPDIYAAGDIVETLDPLTGRSRLIGQWYPSILQARIAAQSMLDLSGATSPHQDSFYNASFLYGLEFVALGVTASPPGSYQELIAPPQPRTYRKLLLHQGVPVGALLLGNRKQGLSYKRAIDHRVNLAPVLERVFTDNFHLDTWLDQQGVPPARFDPTQTEISYTPANRVSTTLALDPLRLARSTQYQQPAEAFLTPMPHPQVPISLDEASLHLKPVNASTVVGRHKEAHIFIDHQSVSRRHAVISYIHKQYQLRDLGSSNGTYVNNARLSPDKIYLLQDGDNVRFGDVQFRWLYQESEETGESEAFAVAGTGHRTETPLLSQEHVRFEIDMCIGCNRCMDACPIPLSAQVSIADLNHATITEEIAPHVSRFTHECILCGSCVPVCPVDNHRDLLMVSLKQRLGASWESKIDEGQLSGILPSGLSIPALLSRLREQYILRDPELVPDNYLLHLVSASQFLTPQQGATLLREGEYGRNLYLILEGFLALSATDSHEREFPVAILRPGELAGEYGMLTGQPYATTARAQTPMLLLQIPEQVMQRLMELVPRIRIFFEQLNTSHHLKSILKRMALFQGISEEALQYLIEQTKVKQYDRNTNLFTEEEAGRPAREMLHILLEGFVKVAHCVTNGQQTSEQIMAYRRDGDYFAGGLDLLGDRRAVTVTSINRTRVAEIPSYVMQALFQRYPEVEQRFKQRLLEYIASIRAVQAGGMTNKMASSAHPALKTGLHSLVSDGVVEGTEVLVIDLDSCIHCNECEEACERRHGHSRMNRQGMVVGNINIVTACRQCQDPVCLLCSRAGIVRLPDGEVTITESCIGCGICAERCPYNAISIVNLDEKKDAEHSSWQRFSGFFKHGVVKERKLSVLPIVNGLAKASIDGRVAPGPLDQPSPLSEMRKKLAIKCDLCAGYGNQACVQACPTGAVFRVKPTTFFGSTEELLKK